MHIITLQDGNIEESGAIIVGNAKSAGTVFVYAGNQALYDYIDGLGGHISNKTLCRLKICKEIEPIDVTLVCGGDSSDFQKLSDLLAAVDADRQQEVVVKGDLGNDKKAAERVRDQLSDIVQQFVYLNIPLDKVQVMTEKDRQNGEKVKRFSKKVKEHQKNLAASVELLSQAKFSAHQEIANEVRESLGKIGKYLEDAQDNGLKIVTAASKKSGKSVIVNSMLKCELAPTSLELATPNNCIYRKSGEGLTLSYGDGKEKKSFSTEKEMRDYIYGIFKQAQMDKESGYAVPDMNIGYIPKNEGFSTYTIYDTPGPGLAGATGHKKAAYAAIKNADVAIFAIDYSKYLIESELDYLQDIRKEFAENNKYYSLILAVNKLDLRYTDKGNTNSTRILDFIRNKLTNIAPEFRNAIVIGTSALAYFNCIVTEEIVEEEKECLRAGSFRDDLEELIEKLSDDVEKSEEACIMQFLNTLASNMKMIDGIRVENLEQIERYSGMPNLLSYVEYIAQSKARVEKVNNLMFKIDNEYAKIQNLFHFQQLEKSLAENREMLEQAKKVLSVFSEEVQDIYDECNKDVCEMRQREDGFLSTTLKKEGDRNPFEIHYIYDFCKANYIDRLLAPESIIDHVVNEIIKSALQREIKKLFDESELTRSIDGERRKVVTEIDLLDKIKRICGGVKICTEKHTKVKLSDCREQLADENNKIKADLAKLVNDRLQRLKAAIEKCKNGLQEECGIRFDLVTPKFDYAFRQDTGKFNELNIRIDMQRMGEDIGSDVKKDAQKGMIKDNRIHNTIDKIFGGFINKGYNRIAYDPQYVMNELYDRAIKLDIEKYLKSAHIEQSYEKEKNAIEQELGSYVDYIKKEMAEQSDKAMSHHDRVKGIIDHTSEYETMIQDITEKQETLQIILQSVKAFCDEWGRERE